MKDPYEKGVANHSAPNFARCVVRHAVKRKTGEEAGWVLSSEKHQSGRQRCQTVRKATWTGAVARVPGRSCVVADPRARLDTFCTRTGRPPRCPRRSGPAGEGRGRKARMHAGEESHCGIVPMNPSNKDGRSPAEKGEGRPWHKENTRPPHTHPTQCGVCVSQGWVGVRPFRPLFIQVKSRMR